MAGRGELTPEIQALANKLFGRGTSVRELRLMPYIQYLAVNSEKLDLRRVNFEELVILEQWEQNGWIECFKNGNPVPVWIDFQFWGWINQFLYIAYVDHNNR